MASNQEFPATSGSDREVAITRLQARIRACRLCEEAGYLAKTHPIVSGQISNRILLIGQAPGHRSIANELPFSGPGGFILQRWLERAGFPPGYLHTHVYLSSLTRCDPGRNPRGSGDRRPSPPEIALCRPYLDEEIAVLQPKVILLVGSMAIEAFFGKARLEAIIGTHKEEMGRFLLPLPHPSGVSRWLNDTAHQQLLQAALEQLSNWRKRYSL